MSYTFNYKGIDEDIILLIERIKARGLSTASQLDLSQIDAKTEELTLIIEQLNDEIALLEAEHDT